MAISLTEVKKKDLQNFFEVIIKGEPLECAKWIYHVSMKKNGLPLTENENPKYFDDLQVMFKRVHQTAL